MRGTVKKIKQGYFFIIDEEGHDRFAHANDLLNSDLESLVERKTTVEFTPTTGKGRNGAGNGLRAESVRVVPE
jgi:cold shock CspA family protein